MNRQECVIAACTAMLLALLSAGPALAGPSGTMLYDQISTPPVGFATSQDFPPAMDASDSAGIDDFLVSDAAGWSIGRFNFNAGVPSQAALYHIRVYENAGGAPGTTVVCEYGNLPAGVHGFGLLQIPLPWPCDLPQGIYWVSVTGEPFGSAVLRWAAQFTISQPPFFSGAPARWQNPGDGFGSGCTSWTNVQNCTLAGDEDPITNFADAFQFQICGTVGVGTGGGGALCGDENPSIELALTAAPDNGNPEQCGTAASIEVEQGEQVNLCYVATNTSTASLDVQSLYDSAGGELFAHEQHILAPGASRQFNRVVTLDASQSYLATWTASDLIPNYLVTQRTQAGTFVDISGFGTALDLGDDGSANVILPFEFELYGIASDRVCINNNGFLLFDTSEPCSGYHQDASIPAAFRAPAIMPYWDDLYTGGNVYYATLGSEPNRRFIVQWQQKNHYNDGAGDPGGITFQVVLDETGDDIAFEYLDTSFGNPAHPEWDHGGSATIGLDYGNLLHSHQGFHSPTLADDSAKDFRSIEITATTATATASIDVHAPRVAVEPASIQATSGDGAPVTQALAIGNTGDRDLLWDLGESPSPRAHFPRVPARVVPRGDPGEADWRPLVRNKPAAGSHAPSPAPFGGFQTTAYGLRFTFIGWEYDTFNDLSDPTDTTLIGTPHDLFYAADFIDGDFSKAYIINEGNSFATISTADGSITYNYGSVQGSPEILFWLGMTWDATTDTIYAVGLDPFVPGPPEAYLARIDLGHGARSTTIGQFPPGVLMIDIAVSPDGLLYGLDIAGDALMAIDKDTAEVEAIGSIGFNANFAQDMDFDDATGVLYLAGVDGDSELGSLYTMNVQTGAATLVGPLREGEQYDGFAIASGTPCRPPQSVPWLSVDPASGTTVPGGSSAASVTLDPAGLGDGVHEASVCAFSNDALNRRVAVPVTFTVSGNDTIFSDGFEIER